MTKKIPLRSEIPDEYTWDLQSIFLDDDEWEVQFEFIQNQLSYITEFQGRLGNNAIFLANWFNTIESIFTEIGKIKTYAELSYVVDMTNQEASSRNTRAQNLLSQANQLNAFSKPELLTIDIDILRHWIKSVPRLAHLGHYVDELERQKPHVCTPDVELVLSSLQEIYNSMVTTQTVMVNNDLKFPSAVGSNSETIPVTYGMMTTLATHPDREMRRTAWESHADQHLTFKNTFAGFLTTMVKHQQLIAKTRGHGSVLEMKCHTDNIPLEVLPNLIDTFKKHLPIWHRYWRVKRKALGYDVLHEYDINASLNKHDPHVPFQKAADWIYEGLKPLGDEYVSIAKRGMEEEGWVDVYPNQGKDGGAFSAGSHGTHPFFMMNSQDKMFSLGTIAHELGHSMNSYYTYHAQPYVYADYSLFSVEVPSNFNQVLVRDYLLKNLSDVNLQIAVIEEAMLYFHRYLFLMPTLARFELTVYEHMAHGKGLNTDDFINLMADLLAEGYGGEVHIDRQRIGITWAEFLGHLSMSYYVYTYTVGLAAAHSLAKHVLANKPHAVENYLKFIKCGTSMYPLDALKMAGVDMTTSTAIDDAFEVLDNCIDQLESLSERQG